MARSAQDAQLAAESTFGDALVAVARVTPRDMTELAMKACLSCFYEAGDFLGLALVRDNSAPIARSVAFSLIQMTRGAAS